MEANKLKSEISTEAWPTGLYPMSVKTKDSKGRVMTGATVTITPHRSETVQYEDRSSMPKTGVTLDKRSSQLNVLIPPGNYEVTFSKGDETSVVNVTVKDPVAITQSNPWKDGKLFHLRDHRWDHYILKENSYGAVKITEDDVALDVGAHIGTFSRSALAAGAQVIAFEPDLDNYRLLLLNGSEYADKFTTVRAAVVADDSDFAAQGYAALWVDADGTGDSSRSALHSLYRTRGARLPVNVPVVNWSDILAKHQPTILKVDVEGAELTYDWSALKVCNRLQQVALEIENKGKEKERKQSIIDNLNALGFTLVKETNGWSTVQIWKK